jgi:hypothetical protein
MTIIRIERLIRRVSGVLQGSEPGGAQIAVDLAEVCREANRRIEECLVSLRHGDMAGAFDLSEAEAPLVEQIRALSFADFGVWVQHCREQGWPISEAPDVRGFQTLQKALQEAKGREADPALVQSFRAAMVAGDRPAALRVLATILRRRPEDAWAIGERGKLLGKESELSLMRLEALLAAGDDFALAVEVDKFEQLGLDPKYRPEVYEAARLLRLNVRRGQAEEKFRQQLKQSEEVRARGDWREVERLLEVAAAELEEAGGRPPEGHLWSGLHQWVRENRIDVEQREELRKQEERVQRELDALEGLRREGTRRSTARLRESLAVVEEFLAMPGPVGVVWPESVHRRLRKEAELLIVDLGRAQKKKWMVVGTAMVMVLATTVGVIQWKQEEIRQEMFLREIDQMITERKVDAAEAWLQSEEAARASGKARGAAELAKLKSFLDQERELRKAAEEEMGRTEKNLTNQALDLFTRWKALAGVEKKISLVPPQWRGALEERRNQALSGLRTQSQESQKTRTRTLQDEMKRVAGEFTNWGQATQNRKEDADKLQLLMERLAGGTVWLQQTEPPELAMPVELEKEFTTLLARMAEAHTRLEDFLQARRVLSGANTFSDYQQALKRLSANPCTDPAEKEQISQVLADWMVEAKVLISLWMPWENPAPAGLAGGAPRLFPKRLEAAEEAVLREIAEDEFLHDIWAYDVPLAKNSRDRYRIYSAGKLKPIPGSGTESPYTFGQGEVFIPKDCGRDEAVKFEKRPRSQALMGIRMDMEKLLIGFGGQIQLRPEVNSEQLNKVRENLEKTLSVDSSSPVARAPIHEALEKLLSNQPGTSPLARAYLAEKVWKLGTVLGDPLRFGLVFSPSLRSATSAWSSLGAIEPGVWLKQDNAGMDAGWEKAFFLVEAPRFVDEAKLTCQLWISASQAGLSFGGWMNEKGEAQNLERLANLEAGQKLVGQGRKGEVIVGWKYDGGKWLMVNEVRPFSPLYLLPRGPETLLQEAIRVTRIREGWAEEWARKHLPMLFGKISESGGQH